MSSLNKSNLEGIKINLICVFFELKPQTQFKNTKSGGKKNSSYRDSTVHFKYIYRLSLKWLLSNNINI